SKETAVVTTFLGPLNKRNPSGFLPSLTPKTYNLKPNYGFVAARQIRIYLNITRICAILYPTDEGGMRLGPYASACGLSE
ncbi:MAG: hypothetical protein IJ089_05490, partial [Clostridia bacterium]|nr:hypothetical protein [Clostridia bacterium]